VLEYLVNSRPFTKNVSKIVQKIRQKHHTLNRTTLQTIQQRYLDRIRSSGVIKNSLKNKARGIRDTNKFLTNPSSLLEDPAPKVDNAPPVNDVEQFWENIY
jgi:hypothetical protein